MKYMNQPKDYNMNLIKFAKNIFSQQGEDGILEEVFKILNIKSGSACEFGAWDGKHFSNTFNLVKNHNWNCIMIESDKNKFNDLLSTAREFSNITAINEIVHYLPNKGRRLDEILSDTLIPNDFDLLSIDVDSCDYHIWKSLNIYNPKIVIIEHSGLDDHIVQREGAVHKVDIDGSTSFHPIKELGDTKGYTLLCDTGNMIFLRSDIFNKLDK